jgi:hypothetical protein
LQLHKLAKHFEALFAAAPANLLSAPLPRAFVKTIHQKLHDIFTELAEVR